MTVEDIGDGLCTIGGVNEEKQKEEEVAGRMGNGTDPTRYVLRTEDRSRWEVWQVVIGHHSRHTCPCGSFLFRLVCSQVAVLLEGWF